MPRPLSDKQRDMLLILGNFGDAAPIALSTYDLFDVTHSIEVDIPDAWTWRDWTREGIYATMRRLEARELVYRQPATDEYSEYNWALTDEGERLVKELSAVA